MTEAQKLEYEIFEKAQQLAALRANEEGTEVKDYVFKTHSGETHLSDLFADHDHLLLIHNMGQGCRYCTLWADGINGVLDHLEDAMAVAMVSKDAPNVQRRMALDRNWKFQMVSHGGGEYMENECSMGEQKNYPGASIYQLKENKILRRGKTMFGPGDLYSPVWHFLSLAGINSSEWTPQFHYWQRPEKLDDGGDNIQG